MATIKILTSANSNLRASIEAIGDNIASYGGNATSFTVVGANGQRLTLQGVGFQYVFGFPVSGTATRVVLEIPAAGGSFTSTAEATGFALPLPTVFQALGNSTDAFYALLGNITFLGNGGSDVADLASGNDSLVGGSGNDVLGGGAGNDTLNGGLGADTMRGGAGNDSYIVDDVNDTVNEGIAGSNGIDDVRASISFSLANSAKVLGSIENLILTGTATINGTGNALANTLIGNAAVNGLTGGAGNDTLNGGIGADTMRGGEGNDVYVVDNAGDKVDESIAGSNGADTVLSSVSFSLTNSATVLGALENLTLTGTGNISGSGNALANVLIGNTGANLLTGGAGADVIDGRAGADYMRGGEGNDIYFVDNAGDKIDESVAGSNGIDSVRSSVSYSLQPSTTVFGALENLSLAGTANINGTGNGLSNTLIGNDGDNVLSGGSGIDRLIGGKGADTLRGGADQDIVDYSIDALTGGTRGVVVNLLGNGSQGGLAADTATDGFGSVDRVIDVSDAIGTQFADKLYGGNSANILRGNAGNDFLSGGLDNDRLFGGVGADRLNGGAGNDYFHFTSLSDSGPTDALRDIIEDFRPGDRLEVSAIDANGVAAGNQAFALDLNGSFSIGEIRQTVSGANLLLEFNADADSATEMSILLMNHGLLASTDFVL